MAWDLAKEELMSIYQTLKVDINRSICSPEIKVKLKKAKEKFIRTVEENGCVAITLYCYVEINGKMMRKEEIIDLEDYVFRERIGYVDYYKERT